MQVENGSFRDYFPLQRCHIPLLWWKGRPHPKTKKDSPLRVKLQRAMNRIQRSHDQNVAPLHAKNHSLQKSEAVVILGSHKAWTVLWDTKTKTDSAWLQLDINENYSILV